MCEVIVITSGKGGVGKSTLTANIGAALAARNQRITLIDLDIGLRNLDVILGLEQRLTYNLIDVIRGRCRLKQALIRDERFPNLRILPSSQQDQTVDLDLDRFREVLTELRGENDYILLDCPAGIERGFQNAIAYADRCILAVTPDIASLRDATKVIHVCDRMHYGRIELLVNKLIPELVLSGDMIDISDITQIMNLPLLGVVPMSRSMILTYNQGIPVIQDDCTARKCMMNIAARIMGDEIPIPGVRSMTSWLSILSWKYAKT